MSKSSILGTEKIGKLLLQQAVPASVGFFVMSIYTIADTFFVGRWVGSLGIAGISIVMPLGFLVGAIGMAIGVGGASIISRALGAQEEGKAQNTFGNQILLTVLLSIFITLLLYVYREPVLIFFGAKGAILPYAMDYFTIQLLGIPLLTWAMMANNVIRAVGKSKMAMYTLIIPAVINVILDPIFINGFDMGIKGASLATVIGYLLSAGYTVYFFLSKHNEIKITFHHIKFDVGISKEILSIGGVSLVRQAGISALMIVLNQTLFDLGGELAVTSYGLINRIMLFMIFPLLGIVQGFLPIAGYNYGAKNRERLIEVIKTAIISGFLILLVIGVIVYFFAHYVIALFTTEQELIKASSFAIQIMFLGLPLVVIQMIGSAYFQALGKPLPALLIALLKPLIFMIPLVLLLAEYFDLEGVWYAFPLADIGASFITFVILWFAVKKL